MKTTGSLVAILILIVAAGYFARELFPKTNTVITPPQITTHYDTVQTIDTLWRTREIEKVIHEAGATQVLVETVTVASVPETVTVVKPAVCPQLLSIAPKVGGQSIVEGFTLAPNDSASLIRKNFRSVYWTAGPLKAMAIGDTLPPILTFYKPPSKGCGFWCLMMNRVISVAAGRASCSVF